MKCIEADEQHETVMIGFFLFFYLCVGSNYICAFFKLSISLNGPDSFMMLELLSFENQYTLQRVFSA